MTKCLPLYIYHWMKANFIIQIFQSNLPYRLIIIATTFFKLIPFYLRLRLVPGDLIVHHQQAAVVPSLIHPLQDKVVLAVNKDNRFKVTTGTFHCYSELGVVKDGPTGFSFVSLSFNPLLLILLFLGNLLTKVTQTNPSCSDYVK